MKYMRREFVEAFKYDGDLMNQDGEYYVPDWAVEAYKEGNLFYVEDGLYVNSRHGCIRVDVGDYIVKDGNELICFAGKHFEARWTPVDDFKFLADTD